MSALKHLTRREIHRLYLHAGWSGDTKLLTRLLLEESADVCWNYGEGNLPATTLLHLSSSSGDLSIVKCILDAVEARECGLKDPPSDLEYGGLFPNGISDDEIERLATPLPEPSSPLSALALASGRGLSGRDSPPAPLPFPTLRFPPNTSLQALLSVRDSNGWSPMHCASWAGQGHVLSHLLQVSKKSCPGDWEVFLRTIVTEKYASCPTVFSLATGDSLVFLVHLFSPSGTLHSAEDAARRWRESRSVPPCIPRTLNFPFPTLQTLIETPIVGGYLSMRQKHGGLSPTRTPPPPPLFPATTCIQWRTLFARAGEEWGLFSGQQTVPAILSDKGKLRVAPLAFSSLFCFSSPLHSAVSLNDSDRVQGIVKEFGDLKESMNVPIVLLDAEEVSSADWPKACAPTFSECLASPFVPGGGTCGSTSPDTTSTSPSLSTKRGILERHRAFVLAGGSGRQEAHTNHSPELHSYRSSPAHNHIDMPLLYSGLTPLMIGLSLGHLETTRMLFQSGASLLSLDNSSRNPLHHLALSTASSGNAELVKLCKEALGNLPIKKVSELISSKDTMGLTAISYASLTGNAELVEMFLTLGVGSAPSFIEDPLLYACSWAGGEKAVAPLLKAHVAYPDPKNLYLAAMSGSTATMYLLLERISEHGKAVGNPNAWVDALLGSNLQGRSPLQDAGCWGHDHLLVSLLSSISRCDLSMPTLGLVEKQPTLCSCDCVHEDFFHETGVVELGDSMGQGICGNCGCLFPELVLNSPSVAIAHLKSETLRRIESNGDSAGWLLTHDAALGGCKEALRTLSQLGVSLESSVKPPREKKVAGATLPASLTPHTTTPPDTAYQSTFPSSIPEKSPSSSGVQPLHIASMYGQSGVAARLLQLGAGKNPKDQNGDTPLHWASFRGHTAVVRVLLTWYNKILQQDETPQGGARSILSVEPTQNPDYLAIEDLSWPGDHSVRPGFPNYDFHNNDKGLPIHSAANFGSLRIAWLLLVFGFPMEARSSEGSSPASNAAFEGHRAFLLLLLKWGCNPSLVDSSLRTPLHEAASNGHVDCINVLLDGAEPLVQAVRMGGPKPTQLSRTFGELLLGALGLGGSTPEIPRQPLTPELRLRQFAILDCQDGGGDTPLHWAVCCGRWAATRALLQRGASCSVRKLVLRNEPLKPLLPIRSRLSHARTIHFYHLRTHSRDGGNALHSAVINDSPHCLSLLLTVGRADPCARFVVGPRPNNAPQLIGPGSRGDTALHLSCGEGKSLCTVVLIAAGAAVNVSNSNLSTPLHAAIQGKHSGCVVALLTAGADISLLNSSGKTPFGAGLASLWGSGEGGLHSRPAFLPTLTAGVPLASMLNKSEREQQVCAAWAALLQFPVTSPSHSPMKSCTRCTWEGSSSLSSEVSEALVAAAGGLGAAVPSRSTYTYQPNNHHSTLAIPLSQALLSPCPIARAKSYFQLPPGTEKGVYMSVLMAATTQTLSQPPHTAPFSVACLTVPHSLTFSTCLPLWGGEHIEVDRVFLAPVDGGPTIPASRFLLSSRCMFLSKILGGCGGGAGFSVFPVPFSRAPLVALVQWLQGCPLGTSPVDIKCSLELAEIGDKLLLPALLHDSVALASLKLTVDTLPEAYAWSVMFSDSPGDLGGAARTLRAAVVEHFGRPEFAKELWNRGVREGGGLSNTTGGKHPLVPPLALSSPHYLTHFSDIVAFFLK